MTPSCEILIVDDEPIVGKRLRTALENSGCTVEVVTSGEAALSRLEQKSFDIVVTDMRMDAVGGLDVLDAVRKAQPRTKTIVITGYASAETAREALAKGAFDFIAKPFQPKELRKMIERAAKQTQRERG